MDAASSLPLATLLGPVTAGTVAWRARGALYVTVVVKATFALVAEGRMTVAEPDPIAAGEQPDASGIGLRTAGDLAPYLGQPEIWLTGHVAVPPRYTQPSMRVVLTVVQGGVVRSEKQLDLDVERAAGNPPVMSIAGMGPIAADWPLRKRWLEAVDRQRLAGPVLDLPDELSWEYFQTSPLDQRLDALRGDEWLVLGGMVATRPRLRTQLAPAWGVAHLYRQSSAAPRAGEPVPLRADTLQVDVDRLRCSILWRGRVQIASEAELGSLRVAAGLEQAGKTIGWVDPFEAEEAARRAAAAAQPVVNRLSKPAQPTAASPFADTMGMDGELAEQLAAHLAALPGVPTETAAKPRALPEAPFAGTTAIAPEVLAKIVEQGVVPFEKAGAAMPQAPAPQRQAPQVPPAPAPQTAAARGEGPFSGTTGISLEDLGKIAQQLATPFEKSRAPAPQVAAPKAAAPQAPAPQAAAPGGEVPFSGTAAISLEALGKLVEQHATPFEKRRAPVPQASTPVPQASAPAAELPFSGTAAISEEVLQKIAEKSAIPFKKADSPLSRAELPFSSTAAIPLGALHEIGAQVATPFEKPHEPRPRAEIPFSGTTAIPLEALFKVAEQPATPFEAARRSPAPPAEMAAPEQREVAPVVEVVAWPVEMIAHPVEMIAPSIEMIAMPVTETAQPALLIKPEAADLELGEMGAAFIAAMAEAGAY